MSQTRQRDPYSEVEAFIDFVGKTTRGGRPGISVITVSVRELEPATDMAAARNALVEKLRETADSIRARLFNLNDRFLVLVPPQDELNFVNYVYQVRMRVIDTVGRQASELALNPAEFTDVLHTKRDASRLARLAQMAVAEPGQSAEGPISTGPLTQEHIDHVVRHAHNNGVQNFVRAYGRLQPIVRFDKDNNVRTVARELHIAMSDLRAHLLPGVQLMANKNLFRELTRKLDEIILTSLAESRLLQGHISVNMNIESMTGEVFERIAERIRERDNTSLWVEMDISDVLANRDAYRRIRRVMDRNKITAVADGVDSKLVGAAEEAELNIAVYKFFAPDDLRKMSDVRAAADKAKQAGKTPVLARVESAGSVDAGQRLGIDLFQGYYIDDLLRSRGTMNP